MIKKKTFKVALLGLLALSSMNAWGQASGQTQYQSATTTPDGLVYRILNLYETGTTNNARVNTVAVKGASYDQYGAENLNFNNGKVTLNLSNQKLVKDGEEQDGVTISVPTEFTIVEIADEAFKDVTKLKDVTIPATITKIGESAFENSSLTSAEIGAGVTTIANSAFKDAKTLADVNFGCTNLSSIGDNALGNTAIKKLDLSQTKLQNVPANLLFTENITEYTALTEVVLPSTVTSISTAFANCIALTSINLEETAITTLSDNALKNDKALTKLSLPNTLQKIGETNDGGVLDGCSALSELNINPKNLQHIYPVGNVKALKTLKIASEVEGENDVEATINANAFQGNSIEKLKIGNLKGAILGKSSFTLAENATITIGDIANGQLKDEVFKIDGGKANITIGDINGGTFGESGKVVFSGADEVDLTIGAIGTALDLNIVENISSLEVTGDITANLSATTRITTATEVNLNAVTIKHNCVGALFAPENELTVTWNPKDDAVDVENVDLAYRPFVQNAFGTQVEEEPKVTLKTTDKINSLYGWTQKNLYNVVFDETAHPDATVEVAGPVGGNAYGKYQAPADKNVKIAKQNGTADVKVYAAYTDDSDAAIYMDLLMRKDGYYVVEKGQAVVICSTSDEDVPVIFDEEAESTMRYDSEGNNMNELQMTTQTVTYSELKNLHEGKDEFYGMVNPVNGFGMSSLNHTKTFPANTLYIPVKSVDNNSAIRIVFLDENGNEEATFIGGVEVSDLEAEDGRIYNLQGIRVDESYKGIVIRNGKKFLQK